MQPAATPTPEASLVTKGAASDPKWPRARGTQPTARDDHRTTAIPPLVIWRIEPGRLQEFSGLSPMHRNHNREYHTANQRGTASPKMITTTSGSLGATDEPNPGLRSASRVSAGRNCRAPSSVGPSPLAEGTKGPETERCLFTALGKSLKGSLHFVDDGNARRSNTRSLGKTTHLSI